jgi:NitT/TauT family transport system ATP-binding protein
MAKNEIRGQFPIRKTMSASGTAAQRPDPAARATVPSPAPPSGGRPFMMPANVRAGQVVGLVEITGGLGSVIDVSRLADEFGADIATLLPILDAAEMLGLVKAEKGDVSLTDLGLKFQKTSKHKVRMLRDVIARIEPFKTTVELCTKNKKGVSAHEVADALLKKGLYWHHNYEMNEPLVQSILIHWGIYAELLSYNGKTGKFQLC